MRRGFTLIELLVVIAIVAILASILFPVFAQARESARQVDCMARFHQVGRAVIMYSGDFDTMQPLTQYYASWAGIFKSRDRILAQLLQPYAKSWTVFRCPSDPNATDKILGECNGRPPSSQAERDWCWSLASDLGYNYAYLSPILCYDVGCNDINYGWRNNPATDSQINSPGNTLLFVDSIWYRNPATGVPEGGGNWIVMPPCRFYRSPNTGQSVDSFTQLYTPRRATRWYSYGGSCGCSDATGAGWMLQSARGWCRWLEFGGTWAWHRQTRSSAVFTDGHTKSFTPSQLTAGCDARPCLGGFITNPQAYMWDMDDYLGM